MSKLEVDTIAPQSGTTITVGEAGDTVDVSNATLSANLNANNLTSGTIPDARFPATLPAVNGSNLTNVQIAGGYTACDAITVTNTATFALTAGGSPVSPESASNCIVSLNGIVQAPGDSYTISGSNITFASALAAGSDVIDFITVLGTALNVGTVSDGTIGLNKLSATGTKSSSTFLRGDNTFDTPPLGGITEADQWRWTANFTGNAIPITANWERNDTSFDKIGTGMSESSGIFTFPQTGIYQVDTFTHMYLNSNSRYNEIAIQLSTDGGSNYSVIADGYTSISNNTSSTTYANVSTKTIIDVTNTSNFKVSIKVTHHDTNTAVAGNSSNNNNATTFIRLGDT